MSAHESDPEQPPQAAPQVASAHSSTIAKLLGREKAQDPVQPSRLQSAKSTKQRSLPKEAYSNVKRSVPKLDPEVDQLLSEADVLTRTKSKIAKSGQYNLHASASRPKTASSTRSKSKDVAKTPNSIYLEGTMTLDALNAELKDGSESTAQLRELIIAANKRIMQLEAQIKRMKEKTSIRAGEDISMLLEQTDAARSISVTDILRPLAPEAPANWELAQEKLKDKCRQLILTLNQEREQHAEVERTLRIENMGLARRLKYSVLRIRDLEAKLSNQNKYIKDCEAAILKQHRVTENLRLRTTRSNEAPTSNSEKGGGTTPGRASSHAAEHASATSPGKRGGGRRSSGSRAGSPGKDRNSGGSPGAKPSKQKPLKEDTQSDSSFHLTPKKKPAASMGSFSEDSSFNLTSTKKANLNDLSDDFDI